MTDKSDRVDRFFDNLKKAVFAPSTSSGDELCQSDVDLSPDETVSHFRIVALAGRGGMGRVYRAHDTRLDRDVALKFLPSYLAADTAERARLMKEARAAAALDHPNVCSVHEIGETEDGRLFIAMPWYEGETLKQRMRRGPMSAEEAVSIARQINSALSAAHSRGVIHRDVKPGNVIILRDGSIRLLDFGLAIAADAELNNRNTPGTVAYMSPEQIRNEPVDGRTDLWSLGVVLYEMIAGAKPFAGANRYDVLRAILNDHPRPLSARTDSVNPRIGEIVEKLLQKDAAARYKSAAELALHLDQSRPRVTRRLITAGIAVVVIAASAVFAWRSIGDGPAVSHATQSSLVILPFANLGSDSTERLLSDGITEELITLLSNTGNTRVIAGSSAAVFKGSRLHARQIADSLGVANVIQGSLQRSGSRVRIQVRLIDGRDGSARWSQQYERDVDDLVALQDEIAHAVAVELDMILPADRMAAMHTTKNIHAYELYLRAADPILLRSESGVSKAEGFYKRAIAADSSYAAAHAGLALTYVRRARNANDPGMAVAQMLQLAEREASRAIALDSTLAQAYFALGRVRESSLDFRGAESALKRAIALDPNRSAYWVSLATLRSWSLSADQELIAARRALDTDPLNPYAITGFASALFRSGRCGESLEQLKRLAAVKPPLKVSGFVAAQCYEKTGMPEKAIAILKPGSEAGDPLYRALLGFVRARNGNREEARQILAELAVRNSRIGGGAFHVAVVHAGLGDFDQAFSWLEKSIDDRSIVSYIMSPTFSELQKDPRFDRIRTRLVQGGRRQS